MFRVPLMPSLPDLLAGMIKFVDRRRTRQASATVETDADRRAYLREIICSNPDAF